VFAHGQRRSCSILSERGKQLNTSKPQGAFNQASPIQDLPQTGFCRLPTVLKYIPISKTIWFEGIKKGIYPKQVRLSERTSAWRCEDIHALIAKLGGEA